MSEKKRTFTDVGEFMVAAWGPRDIQPGPEYVAMYDKVAARLTKLRDAAHGAIGQLVLVISRRLETHGCSMGMPARLRWPEIDQALRLGTLTEPGLVMDIDRNDVTKDLRCSLSTAQHAYAWYGMGWNTRLYSGPITDDILNSFWMHYDTPLEGAERTVHGPIKQLEVIAGDKAVLHWARHDSRVILVRDMARLLGRELSFPALTERIQRDRTFHAGAIEPLWAERVELLRRIKSVKSRFDDRLEEVERLLRGHLEELKKLGVGDSTPNVHLILHVADQMKIPFPR
ncbi:MAG TPA: hypothetical protein VMJ72_02545 [Candidatus Paceibacterota bacterium]|nr:hypothetical protein [Candidatus Paceibacterota bacterium]